jgi:hypothetical protein
MRDPANDRPNSSEVAFIVWVAIPAIGLIVVFLMLGVTSDRKMSFPSSLPRDAGLRDRNR